MQAKAVVQPKEYVQLKTSLSRGKFYLLILYATPLFEFLMCPMPEMEFLNDENTACISRSCSPLIYSLAPVF